jgi:hypothetical protein
VQNANELVMGDGLSQYFEACKNNQVAPDMHVTLQLLSMCPILKLDGHALREREAIALMGGLKGNHHVQGILLLISAVHAYSTLGIISTSILD